MRFLKNLIILLFLTAIFISSAEITNVTLENYIGYDRLTIFLKGKTIPQYINLSEPIRYFITLPNTNAFPYIFKIIPSLTGNVIDRIEIKENKREFCATIFLKVKGVLRYRGFYIDRIVFDFFATAYDDKFTEKILKLPKEEKFKEMKENLEEDFNILNLIEYEKRGEEKTEKEEIELLKRVELKKFEQPKSKEKEGYISLNFIDADFRDIISAISKVGDLNIILDKDIFGEEIKEDKENPPVDEDKNPDKDEPVVMREKASIMDRRVNVSINDVPVMVALELILNSQGLWYTTIYGSIFISKKEKIEREFSEIKVENIQLEYADALSVKKILEEMKLIPTPLSIKVYMGDIIEKQKENKLPSSLEISSQYAEGQSVSAFRSTARSIPNDEISTSKKSVLIVYGTEESIENVKKVVKLIDRQPQQIFLETTIVEISEGAIKDLGLAESQINPITGKSQDAIQSQGGNFYGTFDASNVENEGGLTIFTGKFNLKDDFNLILKSLIQNKKAKILNRPTLTTIDGQPALIEIGNDEPIIRRTESIEGGVRVYDTDVNFRRVGMSLLVTPRIDSFNEITLYLNPVLSETKEILQFYSSTGEMTLRTPIVGVREANTIVRVKDGERVIIGGLMREEKMERETKIPLLSEVPLIGDLFKRKYKDLQKSEIFIIITPFINKDLKPISSPPTID